MKRLIYGNPDAPYSLPRMDLITYIRFQQTAVTTEDQK